MKIYLEIIKLYWEASKAIAEN